MIPGGVASKRPFLFITSHRLLVYTMVNLIHTSGLVEASASMAYTLQSSVCGFGAWTNAVLVAGGSPAGWFHQYPIPWVAWIDGRGQRLSTAACLGGRPGAVTGTLIPGLSLTASPASQWGLVIRLAAVQRRVWWRVAEEQVRRGQIRRCYLLSGWQSNPVWGRFGPAYKASRFQSGPGEMWILNSDWPLGWEAVSGEMR